MPNKQKNAVSVVKMRELLECGVHFGHQTRRWNPKMKPYIFTARNDIHVIDLQKTLKLINQSYEFIQRVVSENKKILFVGTKKQAQEAISEEAARCNMPYINQRWLGGTLTNNSTIRRSIHKLKAYESDRDSGLFDQLSKKEVSRRNKTLTRLQHYLGGIRDMGVLPGALFIVDTKKEQLAVEEANKLGIPIIGIVDTNADPSKIDFPIPANDDAIRSIRLLTSVIANAVIDGGKVGVEAPSTKKPVVSPENTSSDEDKEKEPVASSESSKENADAASEKES